MSDFDLFFDDGEGLSEEEILKRADDEAKLASKIDPNDATSLQNLASNPNHNVWVGASAGTGKTKVLTERVMRLLLPSKGRAATPPDRILCITFTKAAAAEMASRIQNKLSNWVALSHADLKKELFELTGEEPDEELIKEARRLFARVVDHGNRLKIMTIHSFCESLLGRFPIEAGLSPDFTVIDEREAQDILKDIISELLHNESLIESNEELQQALKLLSIRLNMEQFQDLMQKIIGERSAFSNFIKSHGGLEEAIEAIYQASTLQETDYDPDVCLDNYIQMLDPLIFQSAHDCLITSSKKTDLGNAESCLAIHNMLKKRAEGDNKTIFGNLKSFFLTTQDEPRKKFATKDIAEEFPEAIEKLFTEQADFIAFEDRYKQSMQLQATKAMIIFGYIVLASYAEEKKSHVKLDFDDLIAYTVNLLNNSESAAWVLYKIDGGIDHILLDEAQDTSLDQWSVISAISEEFFSGESRYDEDVNRTIFVVGDEKQSIYSFQKADPTRFNYQRNRFHKKLKALGRGLVRVPLSKSFRSTDAVLNTVDNLFNLEWIKAGVTLDEKETIQHFIHREAQAGCFEIWPLAKPTRDEDDSSDGGWKLPIKVLDNQSADDRLAHKIADTISKWIHEKKILKAKKRPINAGDIMILLRSRGTLMSRIVKALKKKNIPVAGVDRIKMKDEIAIKDIVCLAEASLLRDDDLTLATILKSPLIRLSEEELMNLALKRLPIGKSLWHVLSKDESYKEITAYLQNLQIAAQGSRAYEFFAHILESPCPASARSGYHAFVSQLGYECYDPLAEFLNLSLSFEQNHNSHLQKFLDWFADDEGDLKRDAEADIQNQVRIMTVHGSKGLQAPIVFLADASKYPSDKGFTRETLFWNDYDETTQNPLWAPSSAIESSASKLLREQLTTKNDEEYRRLLYVALTRAEDHVILSGTTSKNDKIHEKSWYQLIYNFAENQDIFSQTKFIDDDEKDFWSEQRSFIWETGEPNNSSKPSNDDQPKSNVEAQEIDLPNWLLSPPKAEPTPTFPLTPTNLDEEEETLSLSPLIARDNNNRFLRGTILHNLLQFLPEIETEDRLDCATNFILNRWNAEMSASQAISQSTAKDWASEIVDVLNHPEFKDVFGKDSRAEVPVSGLIQSAKKGSYILSGQIDRLVIKDNEILIIDFKTNRPAAQNINDVPTAYLKQMALYCDALAKIYPDKEIKTAILWTHICKLMILSPQHLDPYRVST